MSNAAKKYKPDMTARNEVDVDLFNDLNFLLLELRTVSPFFGILASEMFIAGPSKSIPTIAVSHRGVVVYNEEFMRGLTPGERIAVFVHEALHVSLDYWARFTGRNPVLSNWAHDFVINDIIVSGMSDIKIVRKGGKETFDLKVKLPAGGAWSQEFKDMSGEEVYNILYKRASDRTKQIKEEYQKMMSDPAAKAAAERDSKINKELRKSLQAGGKKVQEKLSEAESKTKVAREDVVRKENDDFMEALRDRESIRMVSNPDNEKPEDTAPKDGQDSNSDQKKNESQEQDEQKPQEKPQDQEKGSEQNDQPDDSQENDQESPAKEPGEGDKPGESDKPGDDQGPNSGQPGGQEPGDQPGDQSEGKSGQKPGDQPSADSNPGDSPASPSASPSAGGGQAASNPQPSSDGLEIDPAGSQDQEQSSAGAQGQPSSQGSQSAQSEPGQPEGGDLNPYDAAKERMQNRMLDSFHDYMGKEKERISNDVDGTPDGTTRDQHLDDLSNDLDKIGDDYVDEVTNLREQGVEEPEKQKQQGPGKPGDEQNPEPGQDGDSPDGLEGDDGQPGESQPGDGSQGGQPQPGAGKPGQGQAAQGGEPQPGSGQPGQGPVSEKQARKDVQDMLEDMVDGIGNSLGGQPKGMDGLDQQMASGDDAANQEGWDQAMRELADELGSGMDGDVDMDCSDIEGNPYKNETPERLDERRRQMLTRAVVEEAQSGNKLMGKLPGWMQAEINAILYPPMSFAQELEKFVGPYGRPDQRSFSVRNKRNTFMPNHMIRPGMRKNKGKIYVLKDVSGSMLNPEDLKNLQHALGLIEQLAVALNLEVCVIQADTEVTRVMNTQEALEEIRNAKFEIHGAGGSDLRPAFDYIWKEMMIENGNRGNPIIAFTDGVIAVPDEVPHGLVQQCLWVTNPGQNPPTKKWGEHIVMRDL
ncbi:DUF2201 family putative metallopeptidase [Pseudomonas putida]|uniref:Putative metallopeptidase domain-containing protein n=1 Tax=Pseudomonas putida TaxID=303 RepID=A0A8I1ED88_PSEPU|nr:hypothetical protein [Pseudomonas putida]MBI6883128.1 hypothetical protein [Pseudomonas putida]